MKKGWDGGGVKCCTISGCAYHFLHLSALGIGNGEGMYLDYVCEGIRMVGLYIVSSCKSQERKKGIAHGVYTQYTRSSNKAVMMVALLFLTSQRNAFDAPGFSPLSEKSDSRRHERGPMSSRTRQKKLG